MPELFFLLKSAERRNLFVYLPFASQNITVLSVELKQVLNGTNIQIRGNVMSGTTRIPRWTKLFLCVHAASRDGLFEGKDILKINSFSCRMCFTEMFALAGTVCVCFGSSVCVLVSPFSYFSDENSVK